MTMNNPCIPSIPQQYVEKSSNATTVENDFDNIKPDVIENDVSTFDRKKVSPVAQAFFAALDIQEKAGVYENILHNDRQSVQSKNKNASILIRKQIQTLGWRNRYSQCEYYPFSIPTNATSTSATTSTTKFHVRQIQCGEINNTYGTGATVWPASIVLVRYIQRLLANDNDTTKSKLLGSITTSNAKESFYNIIDLGCGTGIMTIALAILFGNYFNSMTNPIKTHIICTDGEDSVVQLANDNIGHAITELNQNNVLRSEGVRDEKSLRSSTKPVTSDIPVDESYDRIVDINDSTITKGFITDKASDDDNLYNINNCSIEVQQYWWGTGTIRSKIMNPTSFFDLIVVSDCVLPKLYPIEPLIDAIDQLLGPQDDHYDTDDNATDVDGTDARCQGSTGSDESNLSSTVTTSTKDARRKKQKMAILSYEYRYYEAYDPKQHVIDLCREKQLQLEVVPIEEQDPIYSIPDDIEIWHIFRK